MAQIKTPQIDNIALWNNIVANKKHEQRDRLLLYRDRIGERYAYYEQHFDSLDSIRPLNAAVWQRIKDDLISCYGNNVAFQQAKREMLNAMPAVNKAKCPYCMLSRPNTLDHYFDKCDYPEYAVFIPNLVPCCSECNSKKGTGVFDNNDNRKYVHFYHDTIPSYQFLFVRFECTESVLVPYIHVFLQFHENDEYKHIIRKHFSNLDLIIKYRTAISDKMTPIIKEIEMSQQEAVPPDEIRILLARRCRALATQYGDNYWETCVYEGLLNSPDYLESLFS